MNLVDAARWLPSVNAALNAIAAILLTAGWIFVRRGDWRSHRAAMTAAFAVSTLFLVWTQTRSSTTSDGAFDFDRDQRALFRVRPDNIFLIRRAGREVVIVTSGAVGADKAPLPVSPAGARLLPQDAPTDRALEHDWHPPKPAGKGAKPGAPPPIGERLIFAFDPPTPGTTLDAATFAPRLRRLVGYSVYSGLIGHIDKHDPIELLDDPDTGGESPMVWDAIG